MYVTLTGVTCFEIRYRWDVAFLRELTIFLSEGAVWFVTANDSKHVSDNETKESVPLTIFIVETEWG